MLSEPRAIFFQTELVWLPPEVSDFRMDKGVVRHLYNKLFEPDFSEHCYENLDLQAQKPTLSSQAQGRRSLCQFGENSITIEEQRPTFTVEDFVDIVVNVLRGLKAVADGIEDTFPPFIVQKCRIHCLAQPNEVDNSLELLASRVSRVKELIEPFRRPPSFFGVRFRFGPVVINSEEDEGEGERHNDFVTVRFETYSNDVSQVWMEVAANFILAGGETANLESIDLFRNNILSAYHFLSEKCKAFLDQFDVPPDAGNNKPSIGQ